MMAKAKKQRTQRPQSHLLRFLGATQTVTGSRFLIDAPEARVLVECGLFQGLKPLRQRNWTALPVEPESIDAVVLTHAHLDHSGYLPALARDGFSGPVFATQSTCGLSGILLPDSGHLQEEEASYANRKGFSKHSPALALYTEEDARRTLGLLHPVAFDAPTEVAPGIRAIFRHAGHILGSAVVTLEMEGSRSRKVTFSGDLGRPHHPVLSPPTKLPETDFLLLESTYGDREHEDEAGLRDFEHAIVRTTERGGVCVIPAFAVDRTEVVLYHLRRLTRAGRVPRVPVYVDSPMALDTLQLYRQAVTSGSPEIEADLRDQKDDDPFDPGNLIEARRVEESMAINDERGPAIIVSASGMATGGRVLHHLRRRLPDPSNCVILVGFQAEGTRGRSLADGAHAVKMLGQYIGVRAEVVNVPAFSVHADRTEILDWLRTGDGQPRVTFLVHGEPQASKTLEAEIEERLGWTVAAPRYLETVRLG